MMSTNDESDDLFNNSYTISEDINGPVFAAAFAVELVLSFVPNLFIVVYTFYNYKVLKQPSMIYLTGLAMSNLLLTVLFMPFTIITAAAGEWIFGRTDEERDGVCTFVGFVFAYGVGLGVHTVALISLDRFLLIVKPLFYRKYMTSKAGVIALTIVWVYAFILVVPTFFGFGRYALSTSTASCIPIWVGQTNFVIYIIVLGLVPSSVILITSLWTFCFTRKFIKRQQSLSTSSHAGIAIDLDEADNVNIYTKRIKKLFGLFGSLLLILIITSSTYNISGMIGLFVGFDKVPPQVYATAFIIFFGSNIANAVVQSSFRSDLKEAIFCGLNKINSCFTCNHKKKSDTNKTDAYTTHGTSIQDNAASIDQL